MPTFNIQSVRPFLDLILQLAPMLPNSGAIGKVIKTITDVTPVLLKTYDDAAPSIKGIINALQANPETTETQFTALDAISLKVDADFDEAVKNMKD